MLARRLLFVGVLGVAACAPDAAPPRTPDAPPPAATPSDARTTVLGPEASPVTFERMSKFPEPGWNVPRAASFSPMGKQVTFLASESGGEEMALYAFDLGTKKTTLVARASDILRETAPMSREEELRRERQRQRSKGITSYRVAKKTGRMLVPLGGDLFVREPGGAVARLTSTKEPEIDGQICATGDRVAFVRGSELFAVDVATKKEAQLTKGAVAGVTHGLSDFNGQEEFDEESGFFWSPTCDKIAYLEVDERKVGTVPVVGYRDKKPDAMDQKYPEAGGRNPSVRVGVVDLKTKATTWLKWPDAGEGYLGRFRWTADGKALLLQRMARDQKRVTVVRADAATGNTKELWTSTNPAWVEFADVVVLEKSARLVVREDHGGHDHLAVRDASTGAAVVPQLTSGAWDVSRIVGVDEAKGDVFFESNRDEVIGRQVWRVPLAGGAATKITREKGVHLVAANRDMTMFVDVHSANDRLPSATVRGADGATLGELPVKVDADLGPLRVRPAELVSIPTDGGVELRGALLKPRNLEAGRKYPVVVMVYGGPTYQAVQDRWSPRLSWQHLADRGFVVFQLDNRGSSGRGRAFEAVIHKRLGQVELADQLAGLRYLKTLPFVDGDRVAIYGHSYGGYMAALAMLKSPGSFQVGIAGSPVTDWRLYDTGYTERYMETPATNAAGYAATDLAPMAKDLTGDLFILHALMDENVHFSNTAGLVDALVAADKRFDLFVFPGERHGYRSPSARIYAAHRVADYLVLHLGAPRR